MHPVARRCFTICSVASMIFAGVVGVLLFNHDGSNSRVPTVIAIVALTVFLVLTGGLASYLDDPARFRRVVPRDWPYYAAAAVAAVLAVTLVYWLPRFMPESPISSIVSVITQLASFFLPSYIAYIPTKRRRNRRAQNLCEDCGYDLRASPERCPECGASNPRAV